MICPKCRQRYAPYPEEDFKFDGKDIIAMQGAEKRRIKVFQSDEQEVCKACFTETRLKHLKNCLRINMNILKRYAKIVTKTIDDYMENPNSENDGKVEEAVMLYYLQVTQAAKLKEEIRKEIK